MPATKVTELRLAEVVPPPPQSALATAVDKVPGSQQVMGVIQILNGPNAGKELELVKNLTTVGKVWFTSRRVYSSSAWLFRHPCGRRKLP